MAINKKTFLSLAFTVSKFLPLKKHIKDLEKVNTESLLFYGELSVIPSFKTASTTLPFYKKILANNAVDISSIRTLQDFYDHVPVIKKEDVFPLFRADELCQNGIVTDMRSAIVTSGTSGVFAYGILNNNDLVFQKKMVDEMMEYYYNAKNESPLIINALPMGVSFTSSYPVISTSVRSDIIIHLIKTFSPYYKKIIIITDPHFAKKIVDDGVDSNINWKDRAVHFVIGGANSSSSLQTYLLKQINKEENLTSPHNTVQGTMGLTEIGLNIFTASKELIAIRSSIEKSPSLLKKIFGSDTLVCPDLFYYYPTSTHIEIHNKHEDDFGDIIITNLDTVSKTPLIRYNTGDVGKLIDRKAFLQTLQEENITTNLPLQLPLIAISGRTSDFSLGKITAPLIKEILYRDDDVAQKITGHFKILKLDSGIQIIIQAKKDILSTSILTTKLQTTLATITTEPCTLECVSYENFGYDTDLNYEIKWKHTA